VRRRARRQPGRGRAIPGAFAAHLPSSRPGHAARHQRRHLRRPHGERAGQSCAAGVQRGGRGPAPPSWPSKFGGRGGEAEGWGNEGRIGEADIAYIVARAAIPPHLAGDWSDPLYGERRVLFRRQSGNARITLFDGGHEIIYGAALGWLGGCRICWTRARPKGIAAAGPRWSASGSNTTPAFGSPADLLIIPDHYVFRMLYSQGVPLVWR